MVDRHADGRSGYVWRLSATPPYHLTIVGQAASTTAEHPFMVHGRGRIDAAFGTAPSAPCGVPRKMDERSVDPGKNSHVCVGSFDEEGRQSLEIPSKVLPKLGRIPEALWIDLGFHEGFLGY